jgi:hypothetical protein
MLLRETVTGTTNPPHVDLLTTKTLLTYRAMNITHGVCDVSIATIFLVNLRKRLLSHVVTLLCDDVRKHRYEETPTLLVPVR